MITDLKPYPAMKDSGVPWPWEIADSVKTGYEISFTRYFYKPQPMRKLGEIRADILAVERETEGLLEEILNPDSL